MNMPEPQRISSRENPLLVRLRKLAQDPGAYRKLGEIWLEGDHLCRALRARGVPATRALLSERGWADAGMRDLAAWAPAVTVLPDALFAGIGGLASPAAIGFVIEAPAAVALDPQAASVVLDCVQDAGNVGSVLRSAAALGVPQVLALTGTAGLWSPKVLRAGMGAHFALRLVEGLSVDDLALLSVPLVATSSHTTSALHQVRLPSPCAWVFGHEGQGVSAALRSRCELTVTIPQPGGEESLNVAAAAAICLYEAARQKG